MNDDDRLDVATERFERRLAEESGKTRAEIADVRIEVAAVRTDVANMRGEMRAEMIHRNTELLKWMLGFFLAQTAGIAGVLALFL